MLNKVSAFIRQENMLSPGDRVICALSGGADSVALLFCLYLLREKLGITLEAAHYNHGLRGAEADRDQAFAESLCNQFDIPIHVQCGCVHAGEKGLEAAARDARYRFLESLPGKIATAHTADDNAETVLMHLIRGTGLRGLGGISPIRGRIIRPMLTVTRQEVLSFLESYSLQYVQDSTNDGDAFLRNRIRHRVMPLLRRENPRLSENLSQTALLLRQEEQIIQTLTQGEMPDIPALRELPAALRRRYLAAFLADSGVREPENQHIRLLEELVFSEKPSACADFPGGIRIGREYHRLKKQVLSAACPPRALPCPGTVEWGDYRIHCRPAEEKCLQWDRFTVYPTGTVTVRSRESGDQLRLSGGTKALKKLFADRKIPAAYRNKIPVLCDSTGVLGVCGIGANLDRITGTGQAIEIRFEKV